MNLLTEGVSGRTEKGQRNLSLGVNSRAFGGRYRAPPNYGAGIAQVWEPVHPVDNCAGQCRAWCLYRWRTFQMVFKDKRPSKGAFLENGHNHLLNKRLGIEAPSTSMWLFCQSGPKLFAAAALFGKEKSQSSRAEGLNPKWMRTLSCLPPGGLWAPYLRRVIKAIEIAGLFKLNQILKTRNPWRKKFKIKF